jgi:hypothetical protein
MNIQVNFHEYLPKNITIQMNMNFDSSNSSWTEYSKNRKKSNSSWIDSNQFESIRIKCNSGGIANTVALIKFSIVVRFSNRVCGQEIYVISFRSQHV